MGREKAHIWGPLVPRGYMPTLINS